MDHFAGHLDWNPTFHNVNSGLKYPTFLLRVLKNDWFFKVFDLIYLANILDSR